MAKYCKNCGSELSLQDKYCSKCGESIFKGSSIIKTENTLAKVGFILSIVTILTCGITSIFSLIISLISLCICDNDDKKGRTYSISGIVISAIMLLFITCLFILGSGEEDFDVSDNLNESNQKNVIQKSKSKEKTTENSEDQANKESTKEIEKEYISVDIDDLEDELEENAAAAQDNYKGKYLAVTGRLSVIDSNLKYIEIVSPTDDWDVFGVTCYIKNSKTREVVKTLTKDQTVLVKGKIIKVGETLGYFMNIDEIISQ